MTDYIESAGRIANLLFDTTVAQQKPTPEELTPEAKRISAVNAKLFWLKMEAFQREAIMDMLSERGMMARTAPGTSFTVYRETDGRDVWHELTPAQGEQLLDHLESKKIAFREEFPEVTHIAPPDLSACSIGPGANVGSIWDAMTPSQRRRLFAWAIQERMRFMEDSEWISSL